jgi:hypothetical protein
MEARVNHSCYILDFIDEGFDCSKISAELKPKADSYLKVCPAPGIEEWEIEFRAIYNNGRQLLVSKNKLGTYPSDKYKQITIAIPIPGIEDVFWGVKSEQYVFGVDHYDKLMKNFNALDVDYEKFDNRSDYIKNCLARAIEFSFTNGIVIKGVKLQIPKKVGLTNKTSC